MTSAIFRSTQNCELVESGDVFVCSHCQWETTKGSIKRNCPKRGRAYGVGDALKEILGEIGVTQVSGCRCGSIQRLMNQAGPDGCIAQISNFAKAIQTEGVKREWPLASSRFALWAIEGLIRKAVKRTRAKNG